MTSISGDRTIPTTGADVPVVCIEPVSGFAGLQLADVWAYRELLYFLIWRDLKVRYKQTALGATWAILQPVLTMVVFSVFFGRLARVPSDGIPYPIFTYAALVPWTFFANGLQHSLNGLVGSANLLKKVYFPRLTIPIATVLVRRWSTSALAFVVLLGMMAFYGVGATAAILCAAAVCAAGARHGARRRALAVGAERAVPRRALRGAVPHAVLAVCHADCLLEHDCFRNRGARSTGFNPMVGRRRWIPLGAARCPCASGLILALSCLTATVLLVSGALYFRRMEQTFADIV